MARRGGGSTGLIWAVVILGFGFVICLTLAIIFSTQVKDAQAGEQRAVEDLADYVTSEEARNPAIVELNAGEGTVVGQLLVESSGLKQKIIGSSQATLTAIEGELATLELGEGQTLIREIQRLRAELRAAADLENALNEKYDAASRRADAAEKAQRQVEGDFRQAEEALKAQIEKLNSDVVAFRAQVAKQKQTLDDDLQRLRTELNETTNAKNSLIQQKDEEIRELQARIKALENITPENPLGEVDPSTLPDGHILSVPIEQNLVYVDLGRNDRLISGITFEVYDRRIGIVKDRNDEYRGKATIEIVNVFDNSAVARVVRTTRGQEIFEGDIIANVVYDPDIQFKFYVAGEFDIDSQGTPTVGDRRRVENMILQWGGNLVSRTSRGESEKALTYDVDFLVLGVEPPLPDPLADDEVDPTVIENHTQAVRKYESYQTLVAEAAKLSIPILNQNRFLVMIGYYNR